MNNIGPRRYISRSVCYYKFAQTKRVYSLFLCEVLRNKKTMKINYYQYNYQILLSLEIRTKMWSLRGNNRPLNINCKHEFSTLTRRFKNLHHTAMTHFKRAGTVLVLRMSLYVPVHSPSIWPHHYFCSYTWTQRIPQYYIKLSAIRHIKRMTNENVQQ